VTRLIAADEARLESILDDTYPTWGEGLSRPAYGAWNRAQTATRWGRGHLTRVAIVDHERLLASAKRYDLRARVGETVVPVLGIGAVFTPPALRGRGHARVLIDMMTAEAADRGCRFALLFSEIGAPYYESLGFHVLPRTLLSIESVRKPGAPATFVRSGEAADLPAIAELSARYDTGASFTLERSADLIEFGFARRRLLAGLGPSGLREVEFFVAEEGHQAVAYAFITRGPTGVVLEECGDRDPAGARLGSLLQVLAGRTPAEPAARMIAWLPPALRPPQVRVMVESPAPVVMMVRPIGDQVMPEPAGGVVCWQTSVF